MSGLEPSRARALGWSGPFLLGAILNAAGGRSASTLRATPDAAPPAALLTQPQTLTG